MKGPTVRLYGVAVGAIVIAAAWASPAGSQEIAGIRFAWEINLTTLAVATAAVIGWYLTVSRQGDAVKNHAETIARLQVELATKVEADALTKMQETIEKLGINIATVKVEHGQLKDEVYKGYLSVQAFKDIKDELREDAHQTKQDLMEAINGLSGRIDNLASVRPAK